MKLTLKLLTLTLLISPLATTLVAAQTTQQDARYEAEFVDQIFAIAQQRCGLTFEATTLEEKKAVLKKMPLETKERILEQLAQILLDDTDHPFVAPKGTDFSQLDMFFILARTLMCHNQELCDKLTHCIGEKELFKLKVRLDKVLALINPTVKEKLTPAPGYKAQMSFISKIKTRICTKAVHAA